MTITIVGSRDTLVNKIQKSLLSISSHSKEIFEE